MISDVNNVPESPAPAASEPFVLGDPARAALVARAKTRHDPEIVDRLVRGMCRGDAIGDAAVETVFAMPGRSGWDLLDRALADGLEAVPDAPNSVRELVEQVTRPPSWVDFERVRRGAIVWWRFSSATRGASVTSLVLGYQHGDLIKALALNGRLVDRSARRVEETARWVALAAEPGGMAIGAPGFRETVRVRLVHAMVRRSLRRSGRWDDLHWGAPVHAAAGSRTLSAFLIPGVRTLRTLGIEYTRDELDALCQLWSWVGYVMGVPEELLPRSLELAEELRHIGSEIYFGPDEDSERLMAALREQVVHAEYLLPPRFREWGRPYARKAIAYVTLAMCRPLVVAFSSEAAADAARLPRGPISHWPTFVRPIARAREAARRRGWLGSDEEISKRQRASFLRTLERLEAPPTIAAEDIRSGEEMRAS